MLRELLAIFRGDHPLEGVMRDFSTMMDLAREMTVDASAVFWGRSQSPVERTGLYEKDVQVNQLQRRVRKTIVAHLSGPERSDVPYCLLVMSLVKDVERIGDYAKNLAEVPSFTPRSMPDDDNGRELQEITHAVETLVGEAMRVFTESDQERAHELTVEGRGIAKRCDQFVSKVAVSNYSAGLAVKCTLGARYYKRIEGHMLNVLSGVLMPLHKLDYYDEDSLNR